MSDDAGVSDSTNQEAAPSTIPVDVQQSGTNTVQLVYSSPPENLIVQPPAEGARGKFMRVMTVVMFFVTGISLGMFLYAHKFRLPRIALVWPEDEETAAVAAPADSAGRPMVQAEPKPAEVSVPPPADKPSEHITKWKRFEDLGLGVSFEYPESWDVVRSVPDEFALSRSGSGKVDSACKIMLRDPANNRVLVGFDGIPAKEINYAPKFCWTAGEWGQGGDESVTRTLPGVAGDITVSRWYSTAEYTTSRVWQGDYGDFYLLPYAVPGYEQFQAAVLYGESDADLAREVYNRILLTLQK